MQIIYEITNSYIYNLINLLDDNAIVFSFDYFGLLEYLSDQFK